MAAVSKRMSSQIDCYDMMIRFGGINDIPIKEIERRARPGQYAESGFLGACEWFKDVLRGDWDTVQALGMTHNQLAVQLDKIWKACEKNKLPVTLLHRFDPL